MNWDPDNYLRFRAERLLPFEDLRPLIRVREGLSVVDLGCGTGELTARLAELLPGSDVLGVDSAASMLERARPLARDGLRFAPGQIEALEGGWDLVFSHAALHWVEEHRALIPRLLARVRPGGQLVAQLPANHDHPAHRLIAAIAGEEPFRTALGGWVRRSPVLTIDAYAELLFAAGGRELTVMEKVYPHLMPDAGALAAWLQSTTLLPYLARLPTDLAARLGGALEERLRRLYPGGPIFYGFRRLILAATRPAVSDI